VEKEGLKRELCGLGIGLRRKNFFFVWEMWKLDTEYLSFLFDAFSFCALEALKSGALKER
jgi:hypothetical protein